VRVRVRVFRERLSSRQIRALCREHGRDDRNVKQHAKTELDLAPTTGHSS
jgi:hypothetical protein